jgi:uncharacterized protein (DUF1697 family)
MERFISILRGINVGGHRKIKMADLRNMYIDLGFKNVQSYIQSGNLVFNSELVDISQLENILEKAILKYFEFEVPVIVRKKHEWEQVIQENPFLNENSTIDELCVTFLSETPQIQLLNQLQSRETENDQIQVIGENAFLKIKGPYHKTPLNNNWIEKTLKVKATTRNWKSVLKIGEMLNN